MLSRYGLEQVLHGVGKSVDASRMAYNAWHLVYWQPMHTLHEIVHLVDFILPHRLLEADDFGFGV